MLYCKVILQGLQEKGQKLTMISEGKGNTSGEMPDML